MRQHSWQGGRPVIRQQGCQGDESLKGKPSPSPSACVRRDHSSYTRVAVLQTWEYLAEVKAIPLGHWQMVTSIATGERGRSALHGWAVG